jgi:tetratricopeptide (TPR) repeat protein
MRGKALQALLLIRKLGGVLGKYKIVVIVLVLVVAGLLGWQHQRAAADNKWKKATDAYRRANYDEAAKILGDSKPPEDPAKLAVYAQTMLATRQLDRAAEAYSNLYKNKKDPSAKLILGNIYNQQKKYDEAAKIYEDLIASNPGYAQAYVNLATLYKIQNKSDKAIEVSQKGVKNNPNNTVLNELLVSMTMHEKDSKAYKDAVAQLKKLNPNDPLLLQTQAQ